MPGHEFIVPFNKIQAYGRILYEVEIDLHLRTGALSFVAQPFLFDTGTQLPMISMAQANRLNIPFKTTLPASILGVTGKGALSAYLSPLWFAFPALPSWQFRTLACFTPYPLKRALLSLSDVHRNFLFRTGSRTKQYPDGSLILRLRRRHHGQPRP